MGRSKIKALDMGSNHSHHNHWRILWVVLFSLNIAGCSLAKVKSGLITAGATSGVVAAVSALTPSAIAPAVAGGAVAASVSAITAEPSVRGEPIAVTADTVVQQAPDNFWTLFGKLIEMGGWALLAVVVVPMIFSWLMPGPIQFKGRKKNGS